MKQHGLSLDLSCYTALVEVPGCDFAECDSGHRSESGGSGMPELMVHNLLNIIIQPGLA